MISEDDALQVQDGKAQHTSIGDANIRASGNDDDGVRGSRMDQNGRLMWNSWISWEEVRLQCKLAAPMVVVNVLQSAIQIIAIIFVGHVGELALSSSSVAVSITNVVGMCVMVGMSSSLETLCGQAYGARQYHMVGVYLQTGLFVLTITCIPIAVIYAYMDNILLLLGQDKEISRKAGEYVACLIPMLFAYASFHPLIRFMQTQSLVYPLVACSCAAIACHVPLCWLLVYKTSLGSKGAAISTSISGWVLVLLLSLYVRFSSSCEKTRPSMLVSWEALSQVKGLAKLAIPSGAMICLEWWCYEILVLLAGLWPDPELQTSTLSICLNTAQVTYMIPFGLSAAVSTRVSNELGAGRSQTTKEAVRAAIGLSVVEACTVSVIILSLHNVLGRVFSSDEDVINNVASILPLLALSSLFDSSQAVLSGVVRGCGWQKFGAFVNLGSFYILALPIGTILGFMTMLKAKGLWIGVTCGPFVQVIIYAALIWKTNWDDEVNFTRFRMESDLSLIEPILS